MSRNNITPPKTRPEDIEVLSQLYDLGGIEYIDISRQENVKKKIKKWPLFEELLKRGHPFFTQNNR